MIEGKCFVLLIFLTLRQAIQPSQQTVHAEQPTPFVLKIFKDTLHSCALKEISLSFKMDQSSITFEDLTLKMDDDSLNNYDNNNNAPI